MWARSFREWVAVLREIAKQQAAPSIAARAVSNFSYLCQLAPLPAQIFRWESWRSMRSSVFLLLSPPSRLLALRQAALHVHSGCCCDLEVCSGRGLELARSAGIAAE